RRLGCDKGCVRMWAGAIGTALQKMAREEVGGPPARARYGWQLRNPIRYARAIADSCVPLQLWWSAKDTIVIDQQRQSERLYKLIRRLNPTAPVTAYHGYWRHSAEMRARTRLPLALATFGLLPEEYKQPEVARALHVEPAPWMWCSR